jgi:hypothetical protein
MRDDIDYRLPEYRQLGFDYFYKFMCESNDVSPDIAVEKWIADDLNFDFEKRCTLALFHGATYAGPCESMFSDIMPTYTADVNKLIDFFNINKKRLLFSPDCKYRKLVFPKFLESVAKSIEPYGTLGNFINSCLQGTDIYSNYNALKQKCQDNWFHWGRMGHWCFSEALHRFIEAPIMAPTMEFAEGKSHRSGWAFCIGRDDLVGDTISKTDCEMLEKTAKDYIEKQNFVRANFFTLETACCNYKRQHKGSRYGGCYIDEQHWELMEMKRDWPEYDWLWNKYLEGRQHVIPHSLLYENNKHDTNSAYIKSWVDCLKNHGRIPRVESYMNNKPQVWKELSNMNFENNSNLEIFF